jgi:hypothetical protein
VIRKGWKPSGRTADSSGYSGGRGFVGLCSERPVVILSPKADGEAVPTQFMSESLADPLRG